VLTDLLSLENIMKYQYITKQAIKPESSWSNADLALFHYSNPNGLMAEKDALNKQISELVDQGKCKEFAVIAYGSLNTLLPDRLYGLVNKKRVSTSDVCYTLTALKQSVIKAREFIAEVNAT
jgi:hypothetical protein